MSTNATGYTDDPYDLDRFPSHWTAEFVLSC